MRDKVYFSLLVLLVIVFSLSLTYFFRNSDSKIKSLETKISDLKVSQTQNTQTSLSRFEIISNEEKVVKALVNPKVKEEVKFLENYKNWPISLSKMGIKFRYPQGLGCNDNGIWKIEEDDQRILLFDCNGFTGEFADTPAYEIRKIDGQEAKGRATEIINDETCTPANNSNYICNEFFGKLYDDKKGYGGWAKYLPFSIRTSQGGTFTYFKFVMHKLDEYPIAVEKIIESIRMTDYNGDF